MAEDGPWHRGSWYQESAKLTALRDQAEAHEVELQFLRDQMVEAPKIVQSLQREVRDLKEGGPAHSSDARSSEAAPSPSPTPPRLPSRPTSRGPSPAPSRSEACVHRGAGNALVDASDRRLAGRPETPMWNWGCHLQTTLFEEHGRGTWREMWEMLNNI